MTVFSVEFFFGVSFSRWGEGHSARSYAGWPAAIQADPLFILVTPLSLALHRSKQEQTQTERQGDV